MFCRRKKYIEVITEDIINLILIEHINFVDKKENEVYLFFNNGMVKIFTFKSDEECKIIYDQIKNMIK